MTEQELKDVLQGAIDGKEIQWKLPTDSDWVHVYWSTLSTLMDGLLRYQDEYQFRVKPEVKTFKYKTRPYEVVFHSGDVVKSIWHSQMNTDSEQAFEDAFPVSNHYKSFKWLAITTEHEVEYE